MHYLAGTIQTQEPGGDARLSEEQRVVENVTGYLRELDFSAVTAESLALAHVDWHEARRLLALGCPHELVVSILL